jgi:hypothetical protein
MSWLVSTLLREKNRIYATADFESDEFNDLLLIDKKIEDLLKKGLLSPFELEILDTITSGVPLNEIETSLKLERHTISKIYSSITNRIAFYLGGYFTDEGYLEYISSKYNLQNNQIKKLEEFMSSKFKFKLPRGAK